MPSSMFFIGLGALLFVCGLVLIALRMIWTGPMSQARRSRTSQAGAPTLEPRGRSGLFDLKSHLPGICLLAAGAVLLIAVAVAD